MNKISAVIVLLLCINLSQSANLRANEPVEA